MYKKKLVILGGSGIGMIASFIAKITKEYEVIGFLNDIIEVGKYIGKYHIKIPVIGRTDDIITYLKMKNIFFFIAYVGLENEKNTFYKIMNLDIPIKRFASLIHPTAIIPYGYCKIGHGVLFAPFTQLSTDTFISDNCILLANSFVGHDSYLDRFAHVATNGVIGANVHIGKGVHIGSNATIREKIVIGNFSLVGAGSVVLKDVESNCIVVGNPARILKYKKT